jgi:DNA-binding transcriptional MerR regulator
MEYFTIRDIENLCDIRAHTLRIWEQRYDLFKAKRKESRHRIYDNEDLKELLRISFLYHNGYKISAIAGMTTAQIQHLVEKLDIVDKNPESFVHQLIEAGIDFDKEKLEKIINNLIVRVGFERCIIAVFYPLLQRIGLLWMTNNVIPAQEHFVSHIIRKKLILAIDGLKVDSSANNEILVFTPTGEQHEIPLLIADYFLKKYNNRTIYFGVNVAVDTLDYYLQYHIATHLYTHILTHLGNEKMNNYVIGLCKKFPDKKIMISGPGCKFIEDIPGNLQILHSVEEFIDFCKSPGDSTL